MSRSSAKGPYIDAKLLKKVLKAGMSGTKMPIKTWARASAIPPEFVGQTFLVHNGKLFKEVFASEGRGHGKIVKRTLTKT
ncbi:MAG: Ribosomal protein S19 [Microgenomates group bacterium GW2011_GWC2_45_8]|nr:MAG: Ribosomal protein S19 [Microgenomates group bacterium GW2011_GWC2_45_8]